MNIQPIYRKEYMYKKIYACKIKRQLNQIINKCNIQKMKKSTDPVL